MLILHARIRTRPVAERRHPEAYFYILIRHPDPDIPARMSAGRDTVTQSGHWVFGFEPTRPNQDFATDCDQAATHLRTLSWRSIKNASASLKCMSIARPAASAFP